VTPRVRKLAFAAHVVISVGWLGAVGAFLAIALAGLTSDDVDVVRGAYVTMEVTGWFVLVPLAVASLLTGIVQSLATKWGLVRHYWVVFKLLINAAATVVLLAYMQTLAHLADVAEHTSSSPDDLGDLRSPSPVLHAGAALALLLVATTLGIYKPRGLTPYGRRRQHTARTRPDA
jgi:hypothetical protein